MCCPLAAQPQPAVRPALPACSLHAAPQRPPRCCTLVLCRAASPPPRAASCRRAASPCILLLPPQRTQVYKARLRPAFGGGEVAVKVQRPDVLEQVCLDLYLMRQAAEAISAMPEVGAGSQGRQLRRQSSTQRWRARCHAQQLSLLCALSRAAAFAAVCCRAHQLSLLCAG